MWKFGALISQNKTIRHVVVAVKPKSLPWRVDTWRIRGMDINQEVTRAIASRLKHTFKLLIIVNENLIYLAKDNGSS